MPQILGVQVSSFSKRAPFGGGEKPAAHAHDVVPDADPDGARDDSWEAEWRRHRFRVLYESNHDDLWRYCLRRAATPEEAEEALGETFAVVWRRLDDVPPGDRARPWIFGVARHHLRTGWRRYRRNDELKDRLIANTFDRSADDPAEAATDDSATILAALATLKERDQEVLRLFAWEGLSQAEIGQLLGCSENAVAIRIHRARGRLAKALRRRAPEGGRRTESGSSKENPKGRVISAQVHDETPDSARKEP